jgi:hypothetical protein
MEYITSAERRGIERGARQELVEIIRLLLEKKEDRNSALIKSDLESAPIEELRKIVFSLSHQLEETY